MQFDIIIIGGGMVGAACAAALRSSQLNIALVDEQSLPAADDQRLIALNYSSYCLINNIHLWQALQNNASPIQEVHISHRKHFGITRLTASELQLPTLGYVVPANYINAALYENVQNITFIRPAKLKSLTQDAHLATITVDTPRGSQSYSGKIIIGADGSHSTVRELLHIPTKKMDYKQSAIVTITELQRSHHHIAYERFLQTGAIAMLPLVGNRAATIWTDENQNIALLQELDDESFLQQLQKQFGYRLGRFNTISKRSAFPLQSITAALQIKERVILIGNALHTLHPIAAQGLNLALYEVAILADYLKNQPADSITLQDIVMPQQRFSLRLSHHLSSLFSNDFFILNTARTLGMLGLDICKPLKKNFIQRIMGLKKDIPSLFVR